MKKVVPFDIEKAKNGAKVVTRCGCRVRIGFFDLKHDEYPILGAVEDSSGCDETIVPFTKDGKCAIIDDNCKDEEDAFDLFIEEEEEETDNYDPYKETVKSIADMVERYVNANSDLKDFYNQVKVRCKEAVEYEKKWLKNQGEQKSFNTDKPKFEVDDWIIKKNIVYHIDKISGVYLTLSTLDGTALVYHKSVLNSDKVHFWTIQDAKPGDVLACEECIVLFKEIDGLNIKCHCTYHFMNTPMFFVGTLQGKDVFRPATKEQRDLLFQKIKEEGYQWDSERKELKEIKYRDDKTEKEVKQKSSFNEFGFRRMTNQELSWWLRDHPEEYRECRFEAASLDCEIFTDYPYLDSIKDMEVPDKYYIRKNGGEWQEPLVEI